MIFRILCIALNVYQLVLVARIILSWVPRVPDGLRPLVGLVYTLTDPPVRIARPLIPPLRVGAVALDLSIMLVFFMLILLQRIVCSVPV